VRAMITTHRGLVRVKSIVVERAGRISEEQKNSSGEVGRAATCGNDVNRVQTPAQGQTNNDSVRPNERVTVDEEPQLSEQSTGAPTNRFVCLCDSSCECGSG
jgi:hypothetical protein